MNKSEAEAVKGVLGDLKAARSTMRPRPEYVMGRASSAPTDVLDKAINDLTALLGGTEEKKTDDTA